MKKVHLILICVAAAIVAITLIFAVFASVRNQAADTLVQVGILPAQDITHVTLAVPVQMEYADYNPSFLNGITLAIEDIAVMNLPVAVNVQVDDDMGDFSIAVGLAHDYINDPAVIGVIGHMGSGVCLPISAIYAREQQTMIVPVVSVTSLTSPPSEYIFRNTPSDGYIAEIMCDFAVEQGAQRAVIFYEDSMYGFEMSVELELYADFAGIVIVDRISPPGTLEEFIQHERKWRALDYDTVFVISNFGGGVHFINLLWDHDFDGVIIGSNAMDNPYLIEYLDLSLRPENSGVFAISSIFNITHTSGGTFEFIERYVARFGAMPDVLAIQQYDSIMIAVHAIAEHDIRTSDELAMYLSTIYNLDSVFGETSFDRKHEIIGKPVYIKQWTGTEFVYQQMN